MVSALSGSLEYGLNTMDRAAMTEKDSHSKLIQLKARHKFPWHFPGISQSLGHKKKRETDKSCGKSEAEGRTRPKRPKFYLLCI